MKTVAAQNIKYFIKDFPELEDDAINAVYDLCEDQDQKVRRRIIPYVSVIIWDSLGSQGWLSCYHVRLKGTTEMGEAQRGRPGAIAPKR